MIDDEPDVGAFVCGVAESLGYETCFADQASCFGRLYRSFRPDLVILDLAIPGIDGIELLQFLAEENSRASILLMSGIDPSMREAALHLGEARGLRMLGVVSKPVRVAELRSLLATFSNVERA
jgi:CheY-like chemotaxis protein